MRTTEENAKIDELARGLLEKRGIDRPTFAEYADAAELCAEAVERLGTDITLAEMLGAAAVGDDVPDETTLRVLARFATDGRFIADCSVEEQEFLTEAIRTEQERERTIVAEARSEASRRKIVAEHPGGVEMIHGELYCGRCGYSLSSGLCRC